MIINIEILNSLNPNGYSAYLHNPKDLSWGALQWYGRTKPLKSQDCWKYSWDQLTNGSNMQNILTSTVPAKWRILLTLVKPNSLSFDCGAIYPNYNPMKSKIMYSISVQPT